MKLKQLEVIKTRHAAYLNAGKNKQPDDCGCAIKLALVSGDAPKLKSREEIIRAAKEHLVCERYGDRETLKFSDIFVSPPNSALVEWEKEEAIRVKRAAAYAKQAKPILDAAELHDDSDADEVMERLRGLAVKHGLTE